MTNLVEIFSSIQGEGIYTGARQVFVRFSGCNLKCAYCDTPYEPNPRFRVEFPAGTREFVNYSNPAGPDETAEIIKKFNLKKHHSISLTGGEPLLHTKFILQLSRLLKAEGTMFYLETNGTLPSHLAILIPVIDIVSMDIKLPSTSELSGLWDTHSEFLQTCSSKEVFVKTVVSSSTTEPEIIEACKIIKGVNPKIPLIIQPVSSHSGYHGKSPSIRRVIKLQELALDYLTDVRVIPQTHKYLGQL